VKEKQKPGRERVEKEKGTDVGREGKRKAWVYRGGVRQRERVSERQGYIEKQEGRERNINRKAGLNRAGGGKRERESK